MRNFAAGIAGILVAAGLVMVIEMAGHTIYPVPAGLDYDDTEALARHIAGLPLGAFLFVGAAYFFGTLGGILAACYVGTAAARNLTFVVGILMLMAVSYNLTLFPHPLVFSLSCIAVVVVAAWLGMTISERAARD